MKQQSLATRRMTLPSTAKGLFVLNTTTSSSNRHINLGSILSSPFMKPQVMFQKPSLDQVHPVQVSAPLLLARTEPMTRWFISLHTRDSDSLLPRKRTATSFHSTHIQPPVSLKLNHRHRSMSSAQNSSAPPKPAQFRPRSMLNLFKRGFSCS